MTVKDVDGVYMYFLTLWYSRWSSKRKVRTSKPDQRKQLHTLLKK